MTSRRCSSWDVSAGTEAAPVASGQSQADRVRVLQQRLFDAEQENRSARHRQSKFEQAAVRQLALLGTPLLPQITVSDGPADGAAHVLGHLDACQLVRDATGRYHMHVGGWAWSLSSTVIAIDLFLDGARWLQLDYGDPRKDVRRHFTGPQEMEYCGFSECLALPESHRPDTPCMLQICDLEGHWRRFEIRFPHGLERGPFGVIPRPRILASLRECARKVCGRLRLAGLAREARRRLRARLAEGSLSFSFLLAVGDVEAAALWPCLQSLRRQIYPRWTLLLVPATARGSAASAQLLERCKGDRRIECLSTGAASSAEAWSQAVSRAAGQYLGVLEPDVCLTADALAWAALAIASRPQAAWLYADGAVVDADGRFVQSDCRPDFSELHLWSRFFTAGFSLYRREDVVRVGGLRGRFRGVEAYDLALRLARQLPPDQIVHLSESLFCRRVDGAEASCRGTEPAEAAGVRAVRDALREAGVAGTVEPHPCGCGVHRVKLSLRAAPRVVVVIPTRDKAFLLRRCIESLRAATRYPNYRVLVINHESTEPALDRFLEENRCRPDFAWMDYAGPFNHSAMHNEALARADAEFAMLLNNDLAAFSDGWLEQLVAVMQLDPRIAGVGAMLVYPDRRVQHGGVILGLCGGAAHAHLGIPSHLPGYQGRLHCLQEMSACTAACLLVRLSAFREVGGFRAAEYPAGFNDVDLWLRLRDAGYRCVYQPAVSAIHYESVSRGATSNEAEAAEHLNRQLAERGCRDPFFNRHLSQDCERFRDLLPPSEAQRAQWGRLLAGLRESA